MQKFPRHPGSSTVKSTTKVIGPVFANGVQFNGLRNLTL